MLRHILCIAVCGCFLAVEAYGQAPPTMPPPTMPAEVDDTDIEILAGSVDTWPQGWCQRALNNRIDRRTKIYHQQQVRELLKAGQASDYVYVEVTQFGQKRRVPVHRNHLKSKVEAMERRRAEAYVAGSPGIQSQIAAGTIDRQVLINHLTKLGSKIRYDKYLRNHNRNLQYLDQDMQQAERDYEHLDRQIVILGDRMDEISGGAPPVSPMPLVCPKCGGVMLLKQCLNCGYSAP